MEDKNTATWSFIVDPKQPHKSIILYKGAPLPDILEASMSLEQVTIPVNDKGEQRKAVLPVLMLKFAAHSLALGTYDSSAAAEPVQQELPLGDKPK